MAIKALLLIIKGICIGLSDTVIGFSGGTMALMLRIYEPIFINLHNLFKVKGKRLKAFYFLFFLVIGIIIGILVFAKIIDFLVHWPSTANPTNSFFLGLMTGVVISLIRKSRFSPLSFSYAIVGFLIPIVLYFIHLQFPMPIIFFTSHFIELSSVSFYGFIYLLIAGFLAVGAMILPGLSGSFILLILGCFYPVLHFISHLDIIPLIPLALGIIIGLFSFYRIVYRAFVYHKNNMYHFIIGLMLSSSWTLISRFIERPPFFVIISLLTFFVALSISLTTFKLSKAL